MSHLESHMDCHTNDALLQWYQFIAKCAQYAPVKKPIQSSYTKHAGTYSRTHKGSEISLFSVYILLQTRREPIEDKNENVAEDVEAC